LGSDGVGLGALCPYKFSNQDRNIEGAFLWVDTSPAISWKLKPWGLPVFVADALEVKIVVGNCANCGGGNIDLTSMYQICSQKNSLSPYTCYYESDTVTVYNLDKGATKKITIDAPVKICADGCFEKTLVGLRLRLKNTNAVGLHSVIVQASVTGQNHCQMTSDCSPTSTNDRCYYFIDETEPFNYPCVTPTVAFSPPTGASPYSLAFWVGSQLTNAILSVFSSVIDVC